MFLNLNLVYKTLWTGTASGLLISMMEKINLFCLTCLTSLVPLMWKWMGLFLRKNHLFRSWVSCLYLSKLDCGSYIISIVKIASDKIRVLIRSMKFFPPEVGLYLYKSTILPWMKYRSHAWDGAPSCYLEMLGKLQKRIFRTVHPSFAASLEPLGHHRNVASLRLSYRYSFGRCSSEQAQLVPLPYSRERPTRNCMIFLSPFLDVIRIFMSTVSFLAQLGLGILFLYNAFFWVMI